MVIANPVRNIIHTHTIQIPQKCTTIYSFIYAHESGKRFSIHAHARTSHEKEHTK